MENKIKVVNQEESKQVANAGKMHIKSLTTGALVLVAIICAIPAAVKFTNKMANKKEISSTELSSENKDDYNSENLTSELTEPDSELETETEIEETETELPENNFSVSGSFVDNHNQELYIFGLEDVKEIEDANVDLETIIESTEKESNKKPTTTTSKNETTSTKNDNKSETSKNISSTKDKTNEKTNNKSSKIVYEGYVMKKLNGEDDGMWYTYYLENGQICVSCDDMSMLDETLLNPNNSNIYGISFSKNVPGWVYVRDNNEKDQNLGLVSDYDKEINRIVSIYDAYKKTNSSLVR